MAKSPVKHKDPITGFALPAIRGNAYERFRPLPVVGFLFIKSNKNMSKKITSIIFYVLAVISLIILIKTELRKWFIFEGNTTPANSFIFWGALVLCVIFFYVGNKLRNNQDIIKKVDWFLLLEQSTKKISDKLKSKNTFVLFVVILLILLFAFYWFQLRPSQIRKECSRYVGAAYEKCLHKSGLDR